MAFRDVVQAIRPAVVGLGILADQRDPLSVVIMGTGFIVDEQGWIMTNRHIADLFIGERDGVVGVRNALARAVLFIDAAGRELPGRGRAAGGVGATPCPIVGVATPPGAEDGDLHYDSVPDLAMCRINVAGLARMGVGRVPHIDLGNSEHVREGDEVGIIGFPLGLTLAQDQRLRQLTPIAQKGVVAATLPWSGVPNPHAFQLDINVNPGSSGSPLFLAETGEVVGVVFAAPVHRGEVMVETAAGRQAVATVDLPTGFGYAVPTARFRGQPRPVERLPDVIHR